MSRLDNIKNRVLGIEINKSWVYLIYVYLLLPALLFLLAWALRSTGMGGTFGTLFHNYGLFIASPIPSASLTGIVGLLLGVFFTAKAVRKRDWLDTGICVVLILANAACYLLELNYKLLPFITLQ